MSSKAEKLDECIEIDTILAQDYIISFEDKGTHDCDGYPTYKYYINPELYKLWKRCICRKLAKEYDTTEKTVERILEIAKYWEKDPNTINSKYNSPENYVRKIQDYKLSLMRQLKD